MREITLQEVLDAREARAERQRRLLAQWGQPLLSCTLNIAGPVKRSALGDFLFRETLQALEGALGDRLLHRETLAAETGPEALLVCALPAEAVKALGESLEDSGPAGRLLDLDVIGPEGEKRSRRSPRPCLVCGGPAGPCARSRAHGLTAVQRETERRLRTFAAGRLGELAVEALEAEVALTPKPGLVDRRNSGAHRDMDLPLFRRSAESLEPYFRRAAALGMEAAACMPELQRAGRAAEETMLAATAGVNTHKGAVYAFGLVLAGLGSVLVRGGDVFETAAALAQAGQPPEAGTHGGRAARLYGAGGARGEALAGFPHARRAWEALGAGGPYAALLTLLAEVEDTNLLHRGGPAGLAFVREEARSILAGPQAAWNSRLEELDGACIARNLSPGGSADLLALALLLGRTEEVWREGAIKFA